MASSRDRLIWFLADPSLSEREFGELAEWLVNGGAYDVVDRAARVRDYVRRKSWPDVRALLQSNTAQEHFDDPLQEHAARLLLREAGMSVSAALRALTEALNVPEPLPLRTSFSAGIRKLATLHGPSAVVSAAQRIRNQVVHQSPDVPDSAWPFRSRESE